MKHETTSSEEETLPAAETSAANPPGKSRKLAIALGVLGACGLLILVVPWIRHSMHTVSTDDAYVNSYVTFVAPRVPGQVAHVLVEDNNRVKKGDVLVQLDAEPYRIKLAVAEAALETSRADLDAAKANTLGQLALSRSARFKLEHTIEDVDNQAAVLRQRVAQWEESKANLRLAQIQAERADKLVKQNAVSVQEADQRHADLEVAQARVNQMLENAHQARVALGLTAEPAAGKNLDDVPADLDQTFSSVREALANLIHQAALLGISLSSLNLTPRQTVEEFYRRDPAGNIDHIYADILAKAPALKQAEARVKQAARDAEQARLDLSYCSIKAEIDGVITRRNVNPGNGVQVGQSLMAVRSLEDIWVDANFKETELRELRIGQHVELKTDMYGGHEVFKGRISGFTMGTGSTLALLPAQNATGNFVKVVQRLPVRIELVDYDPARAPLFVGLSVEPEVDTSSAPTGPNAGQFLQSLPTSAKESRP
jgi:membrane fusion protein (multidrug efflux system)